MPDKCKHCGKGFTADIKPEYSEFQFGRLFSNGWFCSKECIEAGEADFMSWVEVFADADDLGDWEDDDD